MAAEFVCTMQKGSALSEALCEAEEKRLAVRVLLADSNSQVAVMLCHDMLLSTLRFTSTMTDEY